MGFIFTILNSLAPRTTVGGTFLPKIFFESSHMGIINFVLTMKLCVCLFSVDFLILFVPFNSQNSHQTLGNEPNLISIYSPWNHYTFLRQTLARWSWFDSRALLFPCCELDQVTLVQVSVWTREVFSSRARSSLCLLFLCLLGPRSAIYVHNLKKFELYLNYSP